MEQVRLNEVNPVHERSAEDYRTAEAARKVTVIRPEHSDPTFTLILEQQAAKVPSHFFLFFALSAMTVSAALELLNRERMSRFVGMWAPSLLIMGVYNKMVKLKGPG